MKSSPPTAPTSSGTKTEIILGCFLFFLAISLAVRRSPPRYRDMSGRLSARRPRLLVRVPGKGRARNTAGEKSQSALGSAGFALCMRRAMLHANTWKFIVPSLQGSNDFAPAPRPPFFAFLIHGHFHWLSPALATPCERRHCNFSLSLFMH
jgi:hypothetical protein